MGRRGFGFGLGRARGFVFNPLSVVPNVWYDPSDLSSMSQDTGGTVPAAVNSPVGRIMDKSGNGKHLTSATPPTLRQSGSLYYLEFDGVDDGLINASVPLGASVDVMWAFHNSGAVTSHMFLDSAATVLVGVAQDGNASVPGVGTYSVNGAALGAQTRDSLHDTVGSAAPKVIDATAANLSSFTNFRISSFGGFLLSGRLYGVIVAPAMSAANRSAVRTYLGAKAGLTL